MRRSRLFGVETIVPVWPGYLGDGMNARYFTIGLLVGGIAVTVWFTAAPYLNPRAITAEYCRNPALVETLPGCDFYQLRDRGEVFALITVDKSGVKSILLAPPNDPHHLSVDRNQTSMLGTLTVDLVDPASPYGARETTMDNDFDGVPNARMNWESKEFLELHDITWRPKTTCEVNGDGNVPFNAASNKYAIAESEE